MAAPKKKEAGNPDGEDCCQPASALGEYLGDQPASLQGLGGRRTLLLATDLVKFVNVSPVKVKKAQPKKRNRSTEKEKEQARENAISPLFWEEPLQIYGTGTKRSSDSKVTSFCLTDRPGWTATTRDMVKDLISHKTHLTRESYMEPGLDNQKFLASHLATLPFHTLMIQWRISYNFPVYTPRIVYGILSRFGRIDSMGNIGVNSAFVVFHHEYHACRAIISRVGFSYCPLICRWWYQERYKLPLTDPADVKREDLMVSDGRLERNSKRHMAQIKREFWKKAATLSYDVSTFRP